MVPNTTQQDELMGAVLDELLMELRLVQIHFTGRDFISNAKALNNLEFLESFGGPSIGVQPQPTKSIIRFAGPLDRPPICPQWFLAAYPDVATYWTDMANNMADQRDAGVVIDPTPTMAPYIKRAVDSGLPLNLAYFRAMIDIYRDVTGKQLECINVLGLIINRVMKNKICTLMVVVCVISFLISMNIKFLLCALGMTTVVWMEW